MGIGKTFFTVLPDTERLKLSFLYLTLPMKRKCLCVETAFTIWDKSRPVCLKDGFLTKLCLWKSQHFLHLLWADFIPRICQYLCQNHSLGPILPRIKRFQRTLVPLPRFYKETINKYEKLRAREPETESKLFSKNRLHLFAHSLLQPCGVPLCGRH